jgi:hypothetical protein
MATSIKNSINPTSVITAFNNHFFEFVEAVHNAFPNHKDVLITKNVFLAARKANPKLIVKIFKKYVVTKYRKQIEEDDFNYFLEKDYSLDVQTYSHSEKVTQAIDRLRDPIKEMNDEDKLKALKYMQNLIKISDLCEINLN